MTRLADARDVGGVGAMGGPVGIVRERGEGHQARLGQPRRAVRAGAACRQDPDDHPIAFGVGSDVAADHRDVAGPLVTAQRLGVGTTVGVGVDVRAADPTPADRDDDPVVRGRRLGELSQLQRALAGDDPR